MPRRRDQSSKTRRVQNVPSCTAVPLREQSSDFDVANRVDELRQKLSRLMEEHVESLRKQTFLPADEEQREADEKRLKRIREISADYLVAVERTHAQRPQIEESRMTDKPSVKLPGKVEKVIKPAAGEPEKAQIAIEGADPLYREIRIENTLKDVEGQEVRLKQEDEVDVTVETERVSAEHEDAGNAKKQEEVEKKEHSERKAS